VRSYRENVAGGRLSFGRGFAVGILIALISSACYVGAWEIVYLRRAKAFKEMYDNLAINIAMTFMEVFPIGLVVTLISAGLLRKKPRALCG
jgi:hypothetical protein